MASLKKRIELYKVKELWLPLRTRLEVECLIDGLIRPKPPVPERELIVVRVGVAVIPVVAVLRSPVAAHEHERGMLRLFDTAKRERFIVYPVLPDSKICSVA